MGHEDFTPEELALVDSILKRCGITYGELSIIVKIEDGNRTHTTIGTTRSIAEKFRPKHPNG